MVARNNLTQCVLDQLLWLSGAIKPRGVAMAATIDHMVCILPIPVKQVKHARSVSWVRWVRTL